MEKRWTEKEWVEKLMDIVYLLIMLTGIWIIIVGEFALLDIIDLDMTLVNNPWGLVGVMLGTIGLLAWLERYHRKRIIDLEEKVSSMKEELDGLQRAVTELTVRDCKPDSGTETPIETN